jgi:release factor glutamine methyltransferase
MPGHAKAIDALSAASSRAEALAVLRRAFADAGIDTPDLDTRMLLCAILGIDAARLITEPDHRLGEAAGALAAAASRRVAREPVSRILGMREFYGRSFEVTPATLDPRPDSETIIDTVLAYARDNGGRDRHWRILDVGTGTGCLLVTLLAELPNATGLATDLSRDALAVASRNANRIGVGSRTELLIADGLEGVPAGFDILVSNPPYIPRREIAALAPEVRDYDPRLALDGGDDGLAVYRRLAGRFSYVIPDGYICLEVGRGQAGQVARLLVAECGGLGWPAPQVIADLNGVERCVTQIARR